MLKLVKYDFRRHRDTILAVFLVTILAQIWIGFANFTQEDMFMFNTIAYVIAVLILYVFTLRTYVHNLKSYNRRLLPVKTLCTVLSPMLLFLVLLLGVVALVLIHLGVYSTAADLPTTLWNGATYEFLHFFWFIGFYMILVMFSITIALSIRFKGRVWIGIATFSILQYVIGFLEERIFVGYFSALDSAIRVGVVDTTSFNNEMRISQEVSMIWPTLFEAVIAVIMVYGIVKLVKLRVES